MKKALLVLLILITLLFLAALAYAYPKYQRLKPCLKIDSLNPLESCLKELPLLEQSLKNINRLIKHPDLTAILKLIKNTKPLLPHKDYLLGINQPRPTTYLILLQNDNELRTNGGFFGSYATTLADNGHFSFQFQDIGVPDGQLDGHVEPPSPVQRAFGQGWFKLRDSDWEADFPTTAAAIRWFFQKGQEKNPDILLTLSLSTIKKIIDITGEIQVPEYNITIDSNNVYTLLQNQAEMNFFPGSTQKKDALTATGKALLKKLNHLTPQQQISLVNLLFDSLKRQNILVNSLSAPFQAFLLNQNWAGALSPLPCQTTNCFSHTLAIIEANMGANKANCCLKRKTSHTISKNQNTLTHQITLHYHNLSPLENPAPPRFYGGNYINYLRFYLPPDAANIQVDAQPTLPTTLALYPHPYPEKPNHHLNIQNKHGFKEVGLFHTTKANSQSQLTLAYTLPLNQPTSYELNLLKQHGLQSSPQEIDLFNQTFTTLLETDFHTKIAL